jgi:hypothetical protein
MALIIKWGGHRARLIDSATWEWESDSPVIADQLQTFTLEVLKEVDSGPECGDFTFRVFHKVAQEIHAEIIDDDSDFVPDYTGEKIH